MEKTELKELLLQLQSALKETDQLDPELEQMVEEIDQDLHRLADEHDHSPLEDLEDRIESAAVNFEANHPRTSGILREVADLLAKMGI